MWGLALELCSRGGPACGRIHIAHAARNPIGSPPRTCDTQVVLPKCAARRCAASNVSSLVCSPRTSSMSPMTGTCRGGCARAGPGVPGGEAVEGRPRPAPRPELATNQPLSAAPLQANKITSAKQSHATHRVHKVQADHAVGPGRGRRQARDRNGARVAGQHRVRRRRRVQRLPFGAARGWAGSRPAAAQQASGVVPTKSARNQPPT